MMKWWGQVKFKFAKAALFELLKQKDSQIYREITEIARAIAARDLMGYFDQHRINHCQMCAVTGPLLNVEGKYFCQTHAAPMKVKPKLEVLPVPAA